MFPFQGNFSPDVTGLFDDCCNFPIAYILNKLSERRTVIIRTAVTVINVEATVKKAIALCILFQHGFLCTYAHALVVRTVVF